MRVEFEGDDREEIVEQMCNFLSNTADTLNFPDILLWRHERAVSYFKHVALYRTDIEGACRFSLSFVGEIEPWEMSINLDEEGNMYLDCFPYDDAGYVNELECSVEAIPPARLCGGKRIKIRCVRGPDNSPSERLVIDEARLRGKKHVNPSDE